MGTKLRSQDEMEKHFRMWEESAFLFTARVSPSPQG